MTHASAKRENLTHVPIGMKERPQWVVGKYGKLMANGKRAKLPIDPKTGGAASSTNAATWGTFAQAYKALAKYDFMGYMLAPDDPFTFIDLDNVIRDNELSAGAMATIRRFDSYAEVSLSGTGAHIIIEGAVPAGRKRGDIEVYSQARFVVMTGAIIAEQRTVQPRQAILDAFYAETFPTQPDSPKESTTPRDGAALPADDDALLRIIHASKGAAKFDALWNGNTTGYSSESEADQALCAILAFWTANDAERIDRLFRQSGLMRDKWLRRARTGETFGEGTIKRAIGKVTKGYRPSRELTDVAKLVKTNRDIVANIRVRSATQRVMLAILTYAEYEDKATLPISSRYLSDKTGLSHRSTQMELRLLCPDTRQKRVAIVKKGAERTQAMLQRVMLATTADQALNTLPVAIQKSIVAKRGYQGDAAVMAEAAIYLQNKITRLETELQFYATNEAAGNVFDLLTCNSTSDGSALANVYTLLTLQIVSTEDMNTFVCDDASKKTVSIRHCGNNLQSSREQQEFVESVMNDDAFVKMPPAKMDPRLLAIADKTKRARVAALLAPDAKLKPFGLSAPRVFAHLDTNPGADIETIVDATHLSERTVRTVLKVTGAALVEKGHLPLVEAIRQGRKLTYSLAHDWRERLDNLRGDLSTNGLIAARTIKHAGERIRRIEQFIKKNLAAPRKRLDETTKAQYEAIRDRARALQKRLSGGGDVDKSAALAISDALVTVENALTNPTTPAALNRQYFDFSDAWREWESLKAQGFAVKLAKQGDGFAVRL